MEKTKNIVKRNLFNQTVLVPILASEGHYVYTLNQVAEYLWDRLESFQNIDQMADAMTDEFEVDRDVALEDAINFHSDLLEIEAIL